MINIFLDTTGSMSEMGKNSASIYLVKSIQDYCEFNNIQNRLYRLDGEIIDNINSVAFDKNIEIDVLKRFIENQNLVANILISDGLFDEVNLDNTISISVGIDADIYNLKRASLDIFEPENIIEALEYLLFINENDNTQEEEDDDEW